MPGPNATDKFPAAELLALPPQQDLACLASTTNQDVVQAATLDALADRVRIAFHAYQAATVHQLAANANALARALDLGDALDEAQARVAPGGWQRWVQDCGLKLSTSRLTQQLAAHRDEIEAERARVPGLSLRGARRLIAKSPAETGTESLPESDARGAGDRRPRYGKRAQIYFTLKLGAATMAKIAGSSLDRADQLDELLRLNRGAAEGELNPLVRRLVDDAAVGKDVSALATSARQFGGKGTSAGEPAGIEELRVENYRLRQENIALGSQLEETRAELAKARTTRPLESDVGEEEPIVKLLDKFERRMPPNLWKKHQSALRAIRRELDAPETLELKANLVGGEAIRP
jgi:hypothetical protein